MRVTLVGLNYPPEPTGIAIYSGGLAEGLADLGWDVRVITGLPHYPQWRVYEGYGQGETETELGVHVARRRHPVPAKPRMLNRLLMEVVFGFNAAVARWRHPEVVVLVSPALFACVFAALRATLLRKPYVVWVQDIYSLGISETGAAGGLAARLLSLAERQLLRRAARVVAIHERFKAYLVRQLGINPARISVIRNWSHIAVEEGSERRLLRSRMRWPDDVCVVLHAGNMGAKQGLTNVIAASLLAEAEGRNLLFVLMGDGNRRAELEAAGRNSCLQIVNPLPRDEFLDALRAADVLLVNERAGLTEMAVPSKLTSYFATGRPVIAATDVGSVTAIEIELSQAGLRVDADQPAQLVEAAIQLLEDPVRAATLGANGVRFREAHLTTRAAIDSFHQLLTEVARAG